jgi:predicted Zn-dependent peptidase
LFVVGGVDVEQVMQLVRANQAAKTFPPQGTIQRFFEPEPELVGEPVKVIELPVSLPKCLFGFKEPVQSGDGREALRKEMTMKIVLDALLSPSSKLFQDLYDDGLISDSFGHEYNSNSNYAFSVIGGDTKDPDELVRRVREGLEQATAVGVEAASFERSKRKKIGAFMRMMNSPEALANEFTKYEYKQASLFDVLDVYESVTLEDANSRLKEHADFDRFAISIVRSPQK